jgi:hypothetical protein
VCAEAVEADAASATPAKVIEMAFANCVLIINLTLIKLMDKKQPSTL